MKKFFTLSQITVAYVIIIFSTLLFAPAAWTSCPATITPSPGVNVSCGTAVTLSCTTAGVTGYYWFHNGATTSSVVVTPIQTTT